MKVFNTIILFFILSLEVMSSPLVPRDENHPGSPLYTYQVIQEEIKLSGRKINIYIPKGLSKNEKFPVIVYGHGQALNETHYETTFNHLARKGVAVIFPMYDKGFFDRNWKRMGTDYNDLTQQVLQKYKNVLNPDQVIYSGHSKGGYVALMAAGAPNFKSKAKSILLFAPAGFDEEYIKNLTDIPLTLIWGEEDNIIAKSLVKDIYDLSKLKYKQFIEVKNYDEVEADHFYMVTKKTIFGGTDTLNAFHYYGTFKWLVGAARDLTDGNSVVNPYIYGEQTTSTGIEDFKHNLIKNW